MENQLQNILGLFNQNEINSLSEKTGLNNEQTSQAIQEVVPTLLSGIQNNISSNGLSGFLSALDKDHDGSILDDLAGYFNSNSTQTGDGILKYILGDQRTQVENKLAENNHINVESISKLLPLIAPIIMGYLGKEKKSGSIDSGNIGNILGSLMQGKGGIDIGGLIGSLTSGQGQASGNNKSPLGGIVGMLGKLFRK
jgi:hypothetical protein